MDKAGVVILIIPILDCLELIKKQAIIRPKIWNDKNIYFWYRQNILVFSKISNAESKINNSNSNDIVHPELYLSKISQKSESLCGRLVGRIKRIFSIII
jgi:hypothetical protein